MAQKYIRLDRPIKDYSAEELSKLLSDVKNKNSELMRTIIINERDYISINYNRSLRGFWYSTVKPTLDKLGLLTEKDSTEEALTKWDAELSRYVGQLVRSGEVSYQDLRILDISRQRKTPREAYNVAGIETFGHKTRIAPYSNIIITTEKDTVFSIIADLADFFGCSCISGKGQNSLGAMEDLLRNIKAYEDIYTRDIFILTLTDYDPAGYYIADTFRKQVQDLKEGLNIRSSVSIERIGITPDQLTAEEVEQNKYTPKPANRDNWLQATGGINGEAKGLELDALSPDRIRQLFVRSIKKYIDPAIYMSFIKKSYLQKIILEAIKPKINSIIEDLNALELDSIEVESFDLFELATLGHSSIPVDDICYSGREVAIREKALRYFN